MHAVETTPINHIIWTTFRNRCVNGWSIAHDAANNHYLVIQAKALAIFKYDEANKVEKLQEATAFAARNTIVRHVVPDVETNFFSSEDLFIYRRQFCGSGIAYGATAKLAAQKVLERDDAWLKALVLSIGEHTTSLQLNTNSAFLDAASKTAVAC